MFDLRRLPWLGDAPADFRDRCKAVSAGGAGSGIALMSLATHRLTSTQLLSIGRSLKALQSLGEDLSPLSPFRLGVISSSTLDLVQAALPAAAARHGVAVTTRAAEFDQIVQTALNPSNTLFAGGLDGVFLQFDHRWLGLDRFRTTADAAAQVEAALSQVEMVMDGLANAVGAQIIVTTVATPPGALFGSLDLAVKGSVRAQVGDFNIGLQSLAHRKGAIVMDVASMADQVGTAAWFDPVMWHAYKIPMAADCAPLFADVLARQLAAIRGKTRKCLVLDCDNTLWGGVIGDDGLEGIKIGFGSPEGESFLAIQQLAIDLRKRGVILAVSSKNDDATARAPFRQHVDMLLRESDIAVFQANWTDKATNLEAIASMLEIGVDSLVFLDDNAAERAQVREALPLVAVPELPADAALYPLYLASAGYFESLSFSQEDSQRAESYAANARRAEVRGQTRDIGGYLEALQMAFNAQPFNTISRSRIAQLINKSNQFNLTTRRYTEAEVSAVQGDEACITLQARVKDKFSDFGMIGVIIARPREDEPEAFSVDTWLMSCRVLGRKVENAMLQALIGRLIERGVTRLHANYLPTAKNGMVASFFDDLGFRRVAEDVSGARSYTLDVENYDSQVLPFSFEAAP